MNYNINFCSVPDVDWHVVNMITSVINPDSLCTLNQLASVNKNFYALVNRNTIYKDFKNYFQEKDNLNLSVSFTPEEIKKYNDSEGLKNYMSIHLNFFKACHLGSWRVADYLFKNNEINIHAAEEFAFRHSFLNSDCIKKTGQISEICQWLLHVGNELGSPIDLHTNKEGLFRACCLRGNLKLAQWLVNYGFKQKSLIGNIVGNLIGNESLFGSCCMNSNDTFAKWLTELSDKLKKHSDVHFESFSSFKFCCINSYDTFVQWLIELGNELKNKNNTNTNSFLEFKCCANGYDSLSDWLIELGRKLKGTFNADIEQKNIAEDSFSKFKYCCANGYDAFVKWLIRFANKLKNPIDIHAENDSALRFCCMNGNIELLRWLIELGEKLGSPFNLHSENDLAFRLACSRGHIGVGKYLLELCLAQNSPIDILNGSETGHKTPTAFIYSCQNGHIKIGKWLVELANSQGKAINMFESSNMAFNLSCKHGHLDIAKWIMDQWYSELRRKFGISDQSNVPVPVFNTIRRDKRRNMDYWLMKFLHVNGNGKKQKQTFIINKSILIECCINGNLDVLKWFKKSLKVPFNGYVDAEYLFGLACQHGHIEIVKWLYKIFKKFGSVININATKEYAFRWACANGHIEVVEYLINLVTNSVTNSFTNSVTNSFTLNGHKIDIHADNEYAFRWACENGHIDIVKMLIKMAQTETPINIRACNDYAFVWSCNKGQDEIATLLCELCDKYKIIGKKNNSIQYQIQVTHTNNFIPPRQQIGNFVPNRFTSEPDEPDEQDEQNCDQIKLSESTKNSIIALAKVHARQNTNDPIRSTKAPRTPNSSKSSKAFKSSKLSKSFKSLTKKVKRSKTSDIDKDFDKNFDKNEHYFFSDFSDHPEFSELSKFSKEVDGKFIDESGDIREFDFHVEMYDKYSDNSSINEKSTVEKLMIRIPAPESMLDEISSDSEIDTEIDPISESNNSNGSIHYAKWEHYQSKTLTRTFPSEDEFGLETHEKDHYNPNGSHCANGSEFYPGIHKRNTKPESDFFGANRADIHRRIDVNNQYSESNGHNPSTVDFMDIDSPSSDSESSSIHQMEINNYPSFSDFDKINEHDHISRT